MSYVDGFVIAVPGDGRQAFIEHARWVDELFMELGANRIVECWADEVPDGERTDFRRAVQAEAGEIVVFSWVEWPDKVTRDAAMTRFHELAKSDPRFDPETSPPPFDGKRMIFGGFTPVVTLERPKPR